MTHSSTVTKDFQFNVLPTATFGKDSPCNEGKHLFSTAEGIYTVRFVNNGTMIYFLAFVLCTTQY